MTIRRHNPAELHATSGYHHVTTVEGGRTIHLAGQCPLLPDADPHSEDAVTGAGDVNAQVDLVAANTLAALQSAGAIPEDVVRTVIYIASDDPAVLASAWDRFLESDLAAAFSSASTLLGVTALGYKDQLVELDVTAAVAAERMR